MYLHYQSYHHPRVKSGIISCLWTRAETLCKGSNVTKEKEHLHDVFVANGYPEEMVKKSLHKSTRPHQMEQDRSDTICLPYINGLSENVERAIKDINMRAVFKTNLTLRCYLMRVKTPADPINTKRVVYRIPCECGRVYIGEIRRMLKQHIHVVEHT